MENQHRFISFEGIDYSGKSTQIGLLTEKIEQTGYSAIILREPGGTVISERIREILLDGKLLEMTPVCELLLYSAARNQLLTEKVLPALKKGNFVIADRYVDSTSAYQGFGRKIDLEFIRQINLIATNDFKPGITFFIDIDENVFIDRGHQNDRAKDRLEQSGLDFFQSVRTGYLNMVSKEPERFFVINGDRQISQIHEEIWEFIKQKIHLTDK